MYQEKDNLNRMLEGLVERIKPVQQIGSDLSDSIDKLEEAI